MFPYQLCAQQQLRNDTRTCYLCNLFVFLVKQHTENIFIENYTSSSIYMSIRNYNKYNVRVWRVLNVVSTVIYYSLNFPHSVGSPPCLPLITRWYFPFLKHAKWTSSLDHEDTQSVRVVFKACLPPSAPARYLPAVFTPPKVKGHSGTGTTTWMKFQNRSVLKPASQNIELLLRRFSLELFHGRGTMNI